ncbi:MbcA/ParS/Xre antitoxin family protein [Bradyrhizobium liaoningense]|uniref:MbcA/ParS/Xre antitoxin family protein n=1 Tax=Bradyrhizobium liaoningense TaxID=43992 RepID=UPI0039088A8D
MASTAWRCPETGGATELNQPLAIYLLMKEPRLILSTDRGDGDMLPSMEAVREPSKGVVLTKATIRAADRLGMSQRILANVLGLSESAISRMKTGEYVLERGKPLELAVLFVRLYRSLDAIVSGDDKTAGEWLRNENTALKARPIEMIQKVQGLVDAIRYLDARRAII